MAICSDCWHPGDHLDLDHSGQLRLRIITHLELVIEHPDGDTTVQCQRGQHPLAIEHWAEAWTASGVVNAAQRGGGVACRGEAVRFVVDQLRRR